MLQKFNGKLINSEEIEQKLIKTLDSKINSSFQDILNMIEFKELVTHLKNNETSLEDDISKLKTFNTLVIEHFGSFFTIVNNYKVNFKILIKKELKKFIKQYKNMPEILNIEIFIKDADEYGYKACNVYIYLKLMNLSLQYSDINDIINILGILYRAIIVLSCKYNGSVTKLTAPKNIENSYFGLLSMCSVVIDFSLKDNFINKMDNYDPRKIYFSLVKNKKICFRIFLLMNIYLYNSCNISMSQNNSCSLTNAFLMYISNFNNIKKNKLLKISLLIYNYLMYGNSTFLLEPNDNS